MLIHMFIALALGGGDFDPTAIPQDKRIAYVNKLADRHTGLNAAKDYAKAQDDYTPLFELCMDISDGDPSSPCMRADESLFGLPPASEWTDERASIIGKWMDANQSTLDKLKVATRRKRCFQSVRSDSGRLYADVFKNDRPPLIRLGTLMRIKAIDHAMRGEWEQAYEWNSQTHLLAGHLYQDPFSLAQMSAAAVDRIACEQFLALLHRNPPRDISSSLRAISPGRSRHAPQATIDKCESLWTRDYIEAWHEWAQDPDRHPDLTEQADTWLGTSLTDTEGSIFGNSPFKNTESLRKALRASSVEKDWKTSLRADQIGARWDAKPFHVAWKESAEFEREYCEVMLAAPSLAVFGCGKLGSSQLRMLREETAMLRRAVNTVGAIHLYRAKKGRLPSRLEELVPDFVKTVPIDPYSGRPLVYRAKGDDFVLYSVGSDQDDDGGQHTDAFREPGDRVFWPPPTTPTEPRP